MPFTLLKAAALIASFGVDTHIAYTDGGYANLNNVAADLAYLGVWNVRDGISQGENGSAPLSSYIWLANQGVKFTFLSGSGGTWTDATLQGFLSLVDQVNEALPGSVVAVEGPNEINNFPMSFDGVGGLAGAVNCQAALYAAAHADPNLPGIIVDYFTGYGTYGFATGPNPATTPGLADMDTQHPYPRFGEPPASWVQPQSVLLNETAPLGTAVYTETGYSSNGGTNGGLSAAVQGRYVLDLLLDNAAAGIGSTDIYELMDAYKPRSPQGDDGYGLFDYRNAPKPAAVALHNLTQILADPGATANSFTPVPLNLSISGLPATGNVLVAEKSSGVYEIILWQENPIWDGSTGTPLPGGTYGISLEYGAKFAQVNVYSPFRSAVPVSGGTNRQKNSVALGSGAVVVELVPSSVLDAAGK
jgi:hypothetical protein